MCFSYNIGIFSTICIHQTYMAIKNDEHVLHTPNQWQLLRTLLLTLKVVLL